MKPVLSPKELAQAIGVSESSLKRWADEGLIRASRTSGGHRRILIGDALRFCRQTRTPIVRPELLGLPDLSAINVDCETLGSDAERLYAYLETGRVAEARGFILSLYLGGQEVSEIIDGPVSGALRRLGELWKHGPEGIYLEHHASDICVQALNQLRLLLVQEQPVRVAIGGAPAGDPYIIPSLSVATVLTAEGFDAINLGPNTPFEAFEAAVRRQKPQLAWLTISHVADRERLESRIISFALELSARNIILTIGGGACKEIALPALPGVRIGETMTDLVLITRGHAPRMHGSV